MGAWSSLLVTSRRGWRGGESAGRAGGARNFFSRVRACRGRGRRPGRWRQSVAQGAHCFLRKRRPSPGCRPAQMTMESSGWMAPEASRLANGHCQVDEKLVDRPPRYWAPARLERAMLGIRNTRQPQLDNTHQRKNPLPCCRQRRQPARSSQRSLSTASSRMNRKTLAM